MRYDFCKLLHHSTSFLNFHLFYLVLPTFPPLLVSPTSNFLIYLFMQLLSIPNATTILHSSYNKDDLTNYSIIISVM